MSEILKISGLHKAYGRKRVLENFEMTLERGKIHGLLGRNGEGKTTLIRTIMGVIPADRGEILFDGKRVGFGDAEYKREIGYIPESSFFYSRMSVGAILGFNAAFYPKWNARIASESLDRFALDKKSLVRTLSLGQKLKLGFVTALAAEPGLLILDDPTSGLDVPTRRDVLKEVIGELARAGTTVLFASHLVHELERVIDRLAILKGGRLVLDREFEEVREGVRRIRLAFNGEPPADLGIDGVMESSRDGRRIEASVFPWKESMQERLAGLSPVSIEVSSMNLEDIFIAFDSMKAASSQDR